MDLDILNVIGVVVQASQFIMKSQKISRNTYLSASSVAFTTLAASSQAAIVNIDVSSVSGVNGGASASSYSSWTIPGMNGTFSLYNNGGYYGGMTGIDPDGAFSAAVSSTYSSASPLHLNYGDTIDGSLTFTSSDINTAFKYGSTTAPAWGSGSYYGFKDGNGYYGWLEVTWDPGTSVYHIIAGAYNDTPGEAITAGATAVPEPSSLALLAAGSVVAFRRRRRIAA